jgi:hypothetical protein
VLQRSAGLSIVAAALRNAGRERHLSLGDEVWLPSAVRLLSILAIENAADTLVAKDTLKITGVVQRLQIHLNRLIERGECFRHARAAASHAQLFTL